MRVILELIIFLTLYTTFVKADTLSDLKYDLIHYAKIIISYEVSAIQLNK